MADTTTQSTRKWQMARPMPGNYQRFAFNRELLPRPANYYMCRGSRPRTDEEFD